MEVYIPYLVLVGAVVLFYFICYFVFREAPSKKKKVRALQDTTNWTSSYNSRNDYGAEYYSEENKPQEQSVYEKKRIQSDESAKKETVYEKTVAKPEEPVKSESVSKETVFSDATVVMPSIKNYQETVEPPKSIPTAITDNDADLTELLHMASDIGETRAIPPVNIEETVQMSVIDSALPIENDVSEEVPGLKHFINFYGSVGENTHNQVVSITKEAFRRLGMETGVESSQLLENIVVQEALLCMQKAYATTPTVWMKETALEAFLDVIQQPKSSTPYLVAFDALHILPHLTLGHFQSMAIVLLLRYSRNSNNYSVENFRHYVTKYIEPFLSDLGTTDSPYRQLDYLRCTVNEQNPTSFRKILSDVYPFVFSYRGFSLEELDDALDGTPLDGQFITESLNSPLYKLTLVDEVLAARLFRLAHINDVTVQQNLLRLMKSRPASFEGGESREILVDISPSLAELERVYDTTALSGISLTLMGLYLARAHVKITIGEDFDLSRWF